MKKGKRETCKILIVKNKKKIKFNALNMSNSIQSNNKDSSSSIMIAMQAAGNYDDDDDDFKEYWRIFQV